MATADVDHMPAPEKPRPVPQINLQSDSPELSPSTPFQPRPRSGVDNHEGLSTPDGLTATDAVEDGHFKKPRFVARDGSIGGKSHNETNVE